jgi:hypothetical protein
MCIGNKCVCEWRDCLFHSTGGTTLFGAQPQSAAAGMLGHTNKPLFGTATTSSGGGFGTSTSTGTPSLFCAQNKVGLLVHIYISVAAVCGPKAATKQIINKKVG